MTDYQKITLLEINQDKNSHFYGLNDVIRTFVKKMGRKISLLFKIAGLIIVIRGYMTMIGNAAFSEIAPGNPGCTLFFRQKSPGFCGIFSGMGKLSEDIAVSPFDG